MTLAKKASQIVGSSPDGVFTTTSAAPKTMGATTKGTTLDSGDSNYLNGSQVTTSTAGTLSSISVYVGTIDGRPVRTVSSRNRAL